MFHNIVILFSDHYMVHTVNLYTHVQVNLNIHVAGSKNQFFLKEYNILKIYS